MSTCFTIVVNPRHEVFEVPLPTDALYVLSESVEIALLQIAVNIPDELVLDAITLVTALRRCSLYS